MNIKKNSLKEYRMVFCAGYRARGEGECILTLSEYLATSKVQGSRYPARKIIR